MPEIKQQRINQASIAYAVLGGLRYEEAEKTETLWQSMMREYLSFSGDAKSYEAKLGAIIST